MAKYKCGLENRDGGKTMAVRKRLFHSIHITIQNAHACSTCHFALPHSVLEKKKFSHSDFYWFFCMVFFSAKKEMKYDVLYMCSLTQKRLPLRSANITFFFLFSMQPAEGTKVLTETKYTKLNSNIKCLQLYKLLKTPHGVQNE